MATSGVLPVNTLVKSTPILAACAGLLLTTGVGVANAQGDGAEEALDTITVTARKREEDIIEIPIAITAFNSERIESLGLEGILDLPAVTPGFVYEAFAGLPGRFDNSPRFRGISVNSLAPSRQTASIFIDGIFVSNGIQGIGLEDVERIEIIKGPQSAYFGRLTFGGAVNYVTKTPGDEFAGKVNVMAADRDDYSASVSIEGPLIADKLSGRVGASFSDHAGHYFTATSGDELGQEGTKSIGGTLFFTPNDNLSIKLRAHYYENDDGAPAYYLSGLNDHNCGPNPGATDTTICGIVPLNAPDQNVVASAALQSFLTDGRLIAVNGSNKTDYGLDRESTRLSLQFDYRIPDTEMMLSGLFGVNEEEVRLLRDADDSGDLAYVSFSGREFKDDSQELRLSGISLNDKLAWSIGVNAFNQDFTNNGEFIVPSFGDFAFGGGEPAREEVTTTGVFGSLAYDVTDSVRVTLEGRQQTDKVVDDGDITDAVPGNVVEFDNFLPRAIVEYAYNDNTHFYGSYSEGNLPGGFNSDVAELDAVELAELVAIQSTAAARFKEEKLSNFEFGWKQALADDRGTVTLAVFHMERTDQTFRRADRVIDTDPGATLPDQQVNYFINAGESEVDGAEFEGYFNITDGFRLETTLAYIKSKYKVFNSGVHNELFGTEDASGRTAERFPEWSGSLSGVFGGEVEGRDLDWFARADLFYSGERFADEGNLTRAPDGTQLNLRAGIANDTYRLELFLKNATDDDSPTAINRFRDLSNATPLFDFSTFGYQVGLRDRRQFGIRASMNF